MGRHELFLIVKIILNKCFRSQDINNIGLLLIVFFRIHLVLVLEDACVPLPNK